MKHLALMLALCGCAKHPVVVVAATAFTVGGLSCEIQDGDDGSLRTQKICGIIAASAGLLLGGIAALVTELADTTAHQLPPDEELTPAGMVRLHTHTAPPPVPLDNAAPSGGADGRKQVPAVDAGVVVPGADAAVISPPDGAS